MPSVGDLYFDITAKDTASAVLESSIELFKNLQSTAIDTAVSIATAYAKANDTAKVIADAQKNVGDIIIMTTNDYEKSTNKFKRNTERLHIPDKSRESVSSFASAVEGLEDIIVGSLKSFSIFVVTLEGIAKFSDKALEVARSNEVLQYRINGMTEAMNYGRIATEEGSAALREYLETASPSQLRTIKELSESGLNIEYAVENMDTLKNAALIAGTSVEQMYRDLGSGGADLKKYNIQDDIVKSYNVTRRAAEIQQDHWIQYGKWMDTNIARQQAAVEIYATEIEAYVNSNGDFFNTAEGSMARLTLATEKFQNAVGKIYNVGLAPLLNTLSDILTFIADNPLARFVTALGLAGASVSVLAVTLLPKLLSGLTNIAAGTAMGAKSVMELLTVNRAQLVMSFKQISANAALTWEIINQNIQRQKEIVATSKGVATKVIDKTATDAQTASLWVNNNTIKQNALLNLYATLVMAKRSATTTIANAVDTARNLILNRQNLAIARGGVLASIAAKATAFLGATQIAATFATGGLTAGFTALGVAAWAALSPLLPILLPILAVIGAIIVAWKAYETNFAGFKDMIDGFGEIIGNTFGYLQQVGSELFTTFIEPIQTALQPLFDVFKDIGDYFAELGAMLGFTASEGGFFVDVLNMVKFGLTAIWALTRPLFEGLIIPALKIVAQFVGGWIANGIILITNGLRGLLVVAQTMYSIFSSLVEVVGGTLNNAFTALMENPVVKFITTIIDKITEFLQYVGVLPAEVEAAGNAVKLPATQTPTSAAVSPAFSNPVFSQRAASATAIDYGRSPSSSGTSISTGGIVANVNISGMSEEEARNAIDAALRSSEQRQARSITQALHTGIEKYINY